MAVDILSLLEPKIIIILIILASLLIVILLLIITQRKLKRKLIVKEKTDEKTLNIKNEIEKLKNSERLPNSILESLDSFGKNFLRSNFKIQKKLDYHELTDYFKQRKKDKIASFCQEMLESLYSGEKISRERVSHLINLIGEIIEEEYPKIKEINENNIKQPIQKIQQKEITKEPIIEESKSHEPLIKYLALKNNSLSIPNQQKTREVLREKSNEIEEMLRQKIREKNLHPIIINEKNIIEEYGKLQKRFKFVYDQSQKNKKIENLEKLNKLREEIAQAVNEYSQNNSKVKPLATCIIKGQRLLDEISYLG